MTDRCIFFAGGGTGGHIYPALAVAQQVAALDPTVTIHFFCSDRAIDEHILSEAGFEHTILPAKGLSFRPRAFLAFCRTFRASYKIAGQVIAQYRRAVVVGIGGYVAGPVCYAGFQSARPVKLINVDMVPGRANRLAARWADEVFVQFDQAGQYFRKKGLTVTVTGCPLRSDFDQPNRRQVIDELALDKDKKILLITGASSGAASINQTVCSLLNQLEAFADDWQIVHLTGVRNLQDVTAQYAETRIRHVVLGYYDRMADLLRSADLLLGRSGAVSVAEYAAAGVPAICMPYPHHKDRHQYLNADILVEAGAAIIVDDLPDATDRSEWLREELVELMKDDSARQRMRENARLVARPRAAQKIAQALLKIAND